MKFVLVCLLLVVCACEEDISSPTVHVQACGEDTCWFSSGFLIADGFVMTTAHSVPEDLRSLDVFYMRAGEPVSIEAVVAAIDREKDLTVLYVDLNTDDEAPQLTFCDVRIGNALTTFAMLRDEQGELLPVEYAEGRAVLPVLGSGGDWWYGTTETRAGYSGGPVHHTHDGCVVGVSKGANCSTGSQIFIKISSSDTIMNFLRAYAPETL